MRKHLLTLPVKVSILILMTNVFGVTLFAQNFDDALRVNDYLPNITARSLAIGTAFNGISDDGSAAHYNPAGLGLLQFGEFSGSLSTNFSKNTTQFINNIQTVNDNIVGLNSIGYSTPFLSGSTTNGFSIQYGQYVLSSAPYSLTGFNRNSSIVPSLSYSDGNLSDNMGFMLALADTINGFLYTPLTDSLQQTQISKQSTILQNVAIGFGLNVSDWVSLGVRINSTWGQYSFYRQYSETDVRNKYDFLDRSLFRNVDFRQLILHDTLDQSFSAVGIKVGVLVRLDDWGRLGFTADIPSSYTYNESFSTAAVARFDNNDSTKFSTGLLTSTYTVSTPWILNGSLSVHFDGLTIAANFGYRSLPSIRYSDSYPLLTDLNTQIPSVFRSQSWAGLGAEYFTDDFPIVFRGGISTITTPYTSNSFTRNTYSLGLGYFIFSNLRADFGYSYTSGNAERFTNYTPLQNQGGSFFSLQTISSSLMLQITYRY